MSKNYSTFIISDSSAFNLWWDMTKEKKYMCAVEIKKYIHVYYTF